MGPLVFARRRPPSNQIRPRRARQNHPCIDDSKFYARRTLAANRAISAMSTDAITYIKTLPSGHVYRPARALVLIVAENTFNDTGACHVGQRVLCADADLPERTVRRYLARLESDGIIVRESRGRKHGGRLNDSITLVGFREWLASVRHNAAKTKPAKLAALPADQTGQHWPDRTGQQVAGNKTESRTGPVLENNYLLTSGVSAVERPGCQPIPKNWRLNDFQRLCDACPRLRERLPTVVTEIWVVEQACSAIVVSEAISKCCRKLERGERVPHPVKWISVTAENMALGRRPVKGSGANVADVLPIRLRPAFNGGRGTA